MFLASIQDTVNKFNSTKETEHKRIIKLCVPPTPVIDDTCLKNWMLNVVKRIEVAAAKGLTRLQINLLDDGYTSLCRPTIGDNGRNFRIGLTVGDGHHGVISNDWDRNTAYFYNYISEEVYQMEDLCTPAGLLFWSSDIINRSKLLKNQLKSILVELVDIREGVLITAFQQCLKYWMSHSDIPVVMPESTPSRALFGQFMTFDWSPPPAPVVVEVESFEVRTAKEAVLKYQKKLRAAESTLHDARALKRSKTNNDQ